MFLPPPDARQHWLHRFPDTGADGFDRLRAVDGFYPLRFAGGDDAKAVRDALEKLLVSFFDAVADEGQIFLTRAQAQFADFRRDVEEQRDRKSVV